MTTLRFTCSGCGDTLVDSRAAIVSPAAGDGADLVTVRCPLCCEVRMLAVPGTVGVALVMSGASVVAVDQLTPPEVESFASLLDVTDLLTAVLEAETTT